MKIETALEKFQRVTKAGRGFSAQCPSHDDRHNSLSISEGDGGKILLKCQAGCDTKLVIDAVGLTWSDLNGGSNASSFSPIDIFRPKQKQPIAARYTYVAEDSKPLFRVCRTRTKPDGGKDFFQERFDTKSGKFIAGMKDGAKETRRVLYHLPEVIGAETVFCVEGEKDADRLMSAALVATCNPGGAGKWFPNYSQALKGKHVIILPDNDEPGENHALAVAKSVLSLAKSVKVVRLPGLPPKGDVSDYLDGRSKDDLLKIVEAAAPFTASASGNTASPWPQFLSAAQILAAPKDPARWIVEDFLPAGSASVLVAKPKVGKTTIAVDLALSVARGEAFLGRATQQSPVAYVFLDGPATDVADTFTSLGLRETDPVFLHAGTAPADAVAWILSAVKNLGCRLVIIDTLQKLLRFDEIGSYSEVSNRMEPLLDAARKGNCHIMLLHHAKKDSRDDLDAAIGSTAIRGLCYSYLFAKRLPDSTRRILSSDQRGGRNFAEVGVGFDKTTGRLVIQGTLLEVEIEEAEPKILEYVGAEGGDVTEREIGQALPIRAFIISRALRHLYKAERIERTGKGRRGSPFLYSISADLLDDAPTPNTPNNVTTSYSLPSKGTEKSGRAGRESENTSKRSENAREILFPNGREENGKGTEEKNLGKSISDDDGWEFIE